MNTKNKRNFRVASVENYQNLIVRIPLIPCHSNNSNDLKLIKRANRYLKHQERRLEKAIKNCQLELSLTIYTSLIQRSWAFKVAFIHKVVRGWYWTLSENSLGIILRELDRITRLMDSNVIYKRTYIPKGDGRVRPLGVPSVEHRILNAMWALYLRFIIDPLLPEWQFGFRPKRNIVQVWNIIFREFSAFKFIYEFDLKGFFNNVSPRYITDVLRASAFPESLISYISRINHMFPLMDRDKLEEEIEITKYYNGGQTFYRKSGLPQGLPWSPILCMLALSHAFRNVQGRLLMYADDGILLTNNLHDIQELRNEEAINNGIIIADKLKKDGKPSSGVVKDILNLLGHSFNIITGEFKVGDSWILWSKLTKEQLSQIIAKNYNMDESNKVKWFVNVESWMYKHHLVFSVPNALNCITLMVNFIFRKPQNIVQRNAKFFCINRESTRSCNFLLDQIKIILKTRYRTHSFRKIYDDVDNRLYFSIQDIYPLDRKYLDKKLFPRVVSTSVKKRIKLLSKVYGSNLVYNSS